ncbi:MAG: nitroreductase family protein [Dysgonamonadaceae bacterium]|jgi:predicted oxidoreductase (fatty acid repression mutant protein)|nr:nitroreductase family protein [Dysgonamonadaceae bacterium]
MLKKSLKDAIQDRRSYYRIGGGSTISDEKIQSVIEFAVRHSPSAFNSQSARVVLLLGKNHKKLWELVKNELKKISRSEEAFKATEDKINASFLAGHGTALFFEDQSVVKNLQAKFPSYKDNFPVWSEHSSAINQVLTWIALESEGLGASLQHYNPLIDKAVQQEWNINPEWKLVAQMPFGEIRGQAQEKTFEPLENRVLVFK